MFLGSIQQLSKFINIISKTIDRTNEKTEITEDFENLKTEITEAPILAHFDVKKDIYVTTDECNTVLGATVWQKEVEVFRPVVFATDFLQSVINVRHK